MRSPHRQANGALSEAAKRGRALFESPSLGCVSCHSGEQFSDSGWKSPAVPVLHDVGTLSESSGRRLGAPLKGIDTPGLRGLWNAAPYLHDGRAPSLEALWSAHNSQDKHGVTSGLNAAQRADLNAYLRSL